MYFVISTSEDGDTVLEAMEKEELLKRITLAEDGFTDYYGEVEICDSLAPGKPLDLHYGGSNLFIIKGELVVPRVKEVVKVLEID